MSQYHKKQKQIVTLLSGKLFRHYHRYSFTALLWRSCRVFNLSQNIYTAVSASREKSFMSVLFLFYSSLTLIFFFSLSPSRIFSLVPFLLFFFYFFSSSSSHVFPYSSSISPSPPPPFTSAVSLLHFVIQIYFNARVCQSSSVLKFVNILVILFPLLLLSSFIFNVAL